MMSAATSLSPDGVGSSSSKRPTAGVLPEEGPDHFVAPNSGGRPDKSRVQLQLQQAPTAGVLPVPEEVPGRVVASNPGGRRPVETPIQRAPSTVGSLGELSDQQSLNSSYWRDGGPDRRLSLNSSSRRGPPPPARRRPRDGLGVGGPSWLEFFGFMYLTFNTGMAIYQSWGDATAISLVAVTYLNIFSLYVCLRLFQAAEPNSTRRNGLRASAWVLTMALTFGFVYQIFGTATKPTLNVAMLQWAMPAATGIAVFILFCQVDRSDPPLEEESLDV